MSLEKAWEETLLVLSAQDKRVHSLLSSGVSPVSFKNGTLTIQVCYQREIPGIDQERISILRAASYYFNGIKSLDIIADQPKPEPEKAPASGFGITSPEGIWQGVLSHLESEMPKASFDTWVQDTRVISATDNVLVIGARNAYARDWLDSRLTKLVNGIATEIAGREVTVKFAIIEANDPETTEDSKTKGEDDGFEIEIASAATRYAEIVRPEQIVAPYAYAFRLVHFGDITPKQFFLWLGFRQAVYTRWKKGQGTVKNIPWQDVCQFANMKRDSFFAEIKNMAMPGLVQKIEIDKNKRHFRDKSGKLRQRANLYRVYLHPPLARADASILLDELKKRSCITETTLPEERALLAQNALTSLMREMPGSYLAQLPDGDEPLPEIQNTPGLTVMDVIRCLTGIEGDLPETLQKLAEKLHETIISAFGTAQITHYFLETVAPGFGLTHAQEILVLQLRDRCYADKNTGELRDWVAVPGGYRTLSRWAGVSPKRKTVYEWLQYTNLGVFIAEEKPSLDEPEIAEYGLEDAAERLLDSWAETGTRVFSVRMDEPIELSEYGNQTPVGTENRLRRYGNQTVSEYGNQTPVGTENRLLRYGKPTHFKLFKALKPALKTLKSTTTKSDGNAQISEMVVPAKWNLQDLFQNAHVSATKQKQLAGASAEAFVSHLLYAYSQPSLNRSKVGYALEQLALNKNLGAGGIYDELARYSPRALIQLALKTKLSHRREYTMVIDPIDDPLWTSAMGEVNPAVAELFYVLTGSKHPKAASLSETVIETIEFLE